MDKKYAMFTNSYKNYRRVQNFEPSLSDICIIFYLFVLSIFLLVQNFEPSRFWVIYHIKHRQ